ncbi:MAG: cytochrome c peroxidase [Kofleriaceae bacterium]
MKISHGLGWSISIVLAAAAGCGTKKSEPAAGSGSAPAGSGAMAPVQRYSELPGSALPAVELAEDPKRNEKIALGHALFFDKRLSGAADLSCYSCHQNEDGNGGHDPIAIGSGKKPLTRHSPVIWNVGLWKGAFYWDGRAKTLEDNVKGAWGGGNMGAGADTPETAGPKLDAHAIKIAGLPEYKKLFEAAYGKTPAQAAQVTSAIAEYMRTMVCNDTAYDKFVAGDKAALTAQQIRGLDLFGGKGACTLCHNPPQFSNAMANAGGVYHNVGIGTGVAEDKVDIGRMKVSNQATDWAAFKPPSLRNISKSPPYFHDGSVGTLEEAVKIMSSGGIANKNKTPLLEDRKLDDAERADIVAFLKGLECGGKLEPPAAPAKPAKK